MWQERKIEELSSQPGEPGLLLQDDDFNNDLSKKQKQSCNNKFCGFLVLFEFAYIFALVLKQWNITSMLKCYKILSTNCKNVHHKFPVPMVTFSCSLVLFNQQSTTHHKRTSKYSHFKARTQLGFLSIN